jgi:hypothetical protein
MEQASSLMLGNNQDNQKQIEGHRGRTTSPMTLRKQPRQQETKTHNKPNPHEPWTNEDGTYHIPAVINSVISVNSNTKIEPKHSDSISILLDNLRESIKANNKRKFSVLKKHKIILIGDSHIKGYASNIKPLLSDNYNLYSVVKPGSSTMELKDSAKKRGQSTFL